MGFGTIFAYGLDMEENSWLFRHPHFKKASENREGEGKKEKKDLNSLHSPELKPFNLLKSRQLSDLITLEVSGGRGKANAWQVTDVTVKDRARKREKEFDKKKWTIICDSKMQGQHSTSRHTFKLHWICPSLISCRPGDFLEQEFLAKQKGQPWGIRMKRAASCRRLKQKIKWSFLALNLKSI